MSLHSDFVAMQLTAARACGTLLSTVATCAVALRGTQCPDTASSAEHQRAASPDIATEGERFDSLPPSQSPARRLLACARVSLLRCSATAHVGPRDAVLIEGDAFSSACAASWQLPRLQVAMNGADVLRCRGVGVTVSVLPGSPAAGEHVRSGSRVAHCIRWPCLLLLPAIMAGRLSAGVDAI